MEFVGIYFIFFNNNKMFNFSFLHWDEMKTEQLLSIWCLFLNIEINDFFNSILEQRRKDIRYFDK